MTGRAMAGITHQFRIDDEQAREACLGLSRFGEAGVVSQPQIISKPMQRSQSRAPN